MKSYAILIFALLVNSILQVVLLFVPQNTFFIVFFLKFSFFCERLAKTTCILLTKFSGLGLVRAFFVV